MTNYSLTELTNQGETEEYYNTTFCFPTSTEKKFSTLMLNGIMTSICVIFGCFGNAFSIKLMRKLNFGKALRIYLTALAFWDTGVLLSAMAYYGLFATLHLIKSDYIQKAQIWSYLVVVFHGPLSTMVTGSAWTTAAIAVARYFAISKPMQSFTPGAFLRSRFISLVIGICAAIYCIPCYFELRLHECLDSDTGKNRYEIWPMLLLHKSYQIIYRTICYLIFVSFGPFLITLAMSIHLLILMKHRNRNQNRFLQVNEMSSAIQKRKSRAADLRRRNKTIQRRITVLLTILLIKFLICYIVPTIVMVCITIIGLQIFKHSAIKLLADVGNFLIVLNSATNFLIYLIWEKKRVTKKPLTTEKSSLLKPSIDQEGCSCASMNSAPMFTADEAVTMMKTWKEAKERKGNKMFAGMMFYLIDEYPQLKLHLELDKQETINNISMHIFNFIDSLVQIIVSNPNNEFPCALIQQAGKLHHKEGIRLTNEIFRNFKDFLLNEICNLCRTRTTVDLLGMANKSIQSTELQIWNRFLSALISEMKLGYLASRSAPAMASNYLTVANSLRKASIRSDISEI